MFAKVIVDVPAHQVNRPFDYRIPDEFTHVLERGMRVVVPFGRRLVQGFVVDITSQTEFEGEVAAIQDIMDSYPVLNDEFLQLGLHMAQSVYAFQIHCFQTMLPPMLKSSYSKRIIPIAPYDQEPTIQQVANREVKELTPELLQLQKQGKITIETIVTDKATYKTEDWIKLSLTKDQYEELYQIEKKAAFKKRKMLQSFMKMTQPYVQKKAWMAEHQFSLQDVRNAQTLGWITIEKRRLNRDPFEYREFKTTSPLVLNEEQKTVYRTVIDNWNNATKPYLLEGVTGSGKTEVYLHWIQYALQQNQTAMMLVPEISLTPQMVERFKSRFGQRVAVLHSGLSAGEKYDEWRKIKEKQADIVVGARSSIFAPLENVGIIILDEEHETTYKQEEAPRYHARDIAIWRSRYHQCPVVLGSATPSIDSRARAQKGVYEHLVIRHRAKQQPLPSVKIVDMREEFAQTGQQTFSSVLLSGIQDRLKKQEQVVLMLNRRGYSSFVLCRECGHVVQCPNCDISLTLHMDSKTMKCHYCGHEEGIPHRCPKCFSEKIRYFGTGTQKVEEELTELFPSARIIRMDVDTTRKKGQHEALLETFGKHEADILLGTQMIAKGLDFPSVTLVGVINADTALHLPDFRSSEKTFQLLTQVAGRAGRAHLPGEVIIQTFNPEHYAIQYAKHHDYTHFYQKEMQLRRLGQYAPYYFTVMITISDEKEGVAIKKAVEIQQFLKKRLSSQAILLGPTSKSIARVNNRYYFQVIIKYKSEPALAILLNDILNHTQKDQLKGLSIQIDREPIHFM